MDSKIWVCGVVLLLSCLVTESQGAMTHAEFKKRVLSVNPALMKPQCKKIFKSCSMKMFSLIGALDDLKDRWEEYIALPCVKAMLDKNYPDYSLECTANGEYGESVNCIDTAEAKSFVTDSHRRSLEIAIVSGITLIVNNNTYIFNTISL
ncbi:uncharacterized protein LOC121046380 [Ixodes scapularis]|uniref:uncharacterized protein LOC121046380 n=1 Tax=Ixodes scapularis TaxID=6945 RepID=UPI001C38E18C|nr:uncharacterized protein LOC121046380 [Ixodes scapularis]